MSPIRAAVLVPVYFDAQDETYLTLIQRTSGEHPHQGQVAFPGGVHDPARDESLLATALREAEEEVGLAPRDVILISALAEHQTMSSNFLVSPFVGRIPSSYPYRPDPREVESIFQAPLSAFASPENRALMRWDHDGTTFRVPCVRIEPYVVWGLTLRIIDELRAALPELRAQMR